MTCKPFAQEKIFIKPTYNHIFDCQWGFIRRYYTYGDENIERIKKLITIFPDEKEFLNILSRRLKYFYISIDELKYLPERFVWKEMSGIDDVYICRFEQLIRQISEAILYVVQFYIRKSKTYSGQIVNSFEDVAVFFGNKKNGLPEYTDSINNSVFLSIILYIRHAIVHDYMRIKYTENNQNPKIEIENIPRIKNGRHYRHGVFDAYIEESFNDYPGKKTPSGHFIMEDNRFYLSIKFKLTRNCKLNQDETEVKFSKDIIGFTDKVINSFFILFKDIFNTLISEQKI